MINEIQVKFFNNSARLEYIEKLLNAHIAFKVSSPYVINVFLKIAPKNLRQKK